MKKIALFLAWRYLWQSAYEQSTSTMVRICFISIVIGTFSLALVTAIMNGFEQTIHEKMQGIHAQITIRGYDNNSLDAPAIMSVIKNEFPHVAGCSPQQTSHVIVHAHDEREPTVVMLTGINPAYEKKVSTLHKKILKPKKDFNLLIHDNHVIIGKQLAENLGVHVGDSIELFYIENLETKRKKIHLDTQQAIVAGLFNTGIDEYDTNVIFCSDDFIQTLFGQGVTHINVKLNADADEQMVITRLRQRFDLPVHSWKDAYPALVSALKLEKYAMFFILSLITLVASMNIIALLFMQITQKRPDIALLKVLGANDQLFTSIFLCIGLIITSIASAIGLFFACIVSYFLEHYPCIDLPDAYLVSHLPAKMEWHIIILVFVLVLILTLFATWLPTRRIKQWNIANILRFEG